MLIKLWPIVHNIIYTDFIISSKSIYYYKKISIFGNPIIDIGVLS
jgi:hypothetical protein